MPVIRTVILAARPKLELYLRDGRTLRILKMYVSFSGRDVAASQLKVKKNKNLVFDIVWYVFVMKMSRKLLT